jgi:tetratricopeptide (TPR) repeat protein
MIKYIKPAFFIFILSVGLNLQAQNINEYRKLIEEANLYLEAGDIGFARIDYEKAVKINPSDEYPRLKLAELDRLAQTQKEKDSLFEQRLINAERYYKAGNYNLAQAAFIKSLELKPESVFVKERLASISNLNIKGESQIKDKGSNSLSSINKQEEKSTVNISSVQKAETKPTPTEFKNQPSAENRASQKKSEGKNELQKAISIPSVETTSQPSPVQVFLNQADEYLKVNDFENAIQQFQSASALKPTDKTIKSQLLSAKTQLEKRRKDEKAYTDFITAAKKDSVQNNTRGAIESYENALKLKPNDAFIQNKLITLRDKLTVEIKLDQEFKSIVIKADSLFHANKFTEAGIFYEQARNIKPEDKSVKDKLLEINRIETIANGEKLKKYKDALDLADALIKQEDWQGAIQSYIQASELQPKEQYPKQRITELNEKLQTLEAQLLAAYNIAITDGDKAYQTRSWDIAMDKYLQAARAKTSNNLAENQISKILSFLEGKLVLTLTPPNSSLQVEKELKLSFKALELSKRRNNYLIIRMKNNAAGSPRLYINYGMNEQKNGGIIFRSILKGNKYIDYVVKLGNQDRWFRLYNNWITLMVEGSPLEIENLKICADI